MNEDRINDLALLMAHRSIDTKKSVIIVSFFFLSLSLSAGDHVSIIDGTSA